MVGVLALHLAKQDRFNPQHPNMAPLNPPRVMPQYRAEISSDCLFAYLVW